MWDYICPRCRREVSKNSHKCPYCGERFPFPLRVPPKCLRSPEALEEYVHKHVFPRISAWQREYLAQFFTTFFSDGFESGDFSQWTGTSNGNNGLISIVTSPVHHGTYAAKSYLAANNDAWATCYKTFATSYSVLYARAYILFDALPANGQHRQISPCIMDVNAQYHLSSVFLFNDNGNYKWELRYKTNSVNENIAYSAAETINANQWYCIEAYFKGANDGTGEVKLWVDGVLKISVTGLNNGNVLARSVWMGGWQNGTGKPAVNIYIDCVVVADAYIGLEGIVLKQWSQALNTSHVFKRPFRIFKLSQTLNVAHVFSRPSRFFKLTQELTTSHVYLRHRFMRLSQALRTLAAWTVTYPGLILKQWLAAVQTTHTFRRPYRFMKLTQTLQTSHIYIRNCLFKLIQTLNISHVFTRPFRRIGYTQRLQPAHVFRRPLRLIRFPAFLQPTHLFNRPTRFMKLVERLTLGHAYFVVIPGAKKTRLFLVIGDLAIQLSND